MGEENRMRKDCVKVGGSFHQLLIPLGMRDLHPAAAWSDLGRGTRTPALLNEPAPVRALGFLLPETLSHFLSPALTFEPSFPLPWRSDSLLKCWVTLRIKDG